MLSRRTEISLGVALSLLSGMILCVWIPLDAETGLFTVFRRQTNIGDAFVPTIAAAVMLICSLAHLAQSLRRPRSDTRLADVWNRESVMVLGAVGLACALGLAIMFWAGPLTVALFAHADDGGRPTYRQLRTTFPWSQIGFFLGGFVLVFGISSFIEGQMRWSRAAMAAASVLLLFTVFDLPFPNILLPPNGDW